MTDDRGSQEHKDTRSHVTRDEGRGMKDEKRWAAADATVATADVELTATADAAVRHRRPMGFARYLSLFF